MAGGRGPGRHPGDDAGAPGLTIGSAPSRPPGRLARRKPQMHICHRHARSLAQIHTIVSVGIAPRDVHRETASTACATRHPDPSCRRAASVLPSISLPPIVPGVRGPQRRWRLASRPVRARPVLESPAPPPLEARYGRLSPQFIAPSDMQWLNPVVAILARMVHQSVAPLNAQRTRRIAATIASHLCAGTRRAPSPRSTGNSRRSADRIRPSRLGLAGADAQSLGPRRPWTRRPWTRRKAE